MRVFLLKCLKRAIFCSLSFGEIIDQSGAQSHIDEATTTSILSEKKFFFCYEILLWI
jgi:hypothetical protein